MGNGEPEEVQPQTFSGYSGPVYSRFDIRADWLPVTRDPVKNYFDLKSKIQVFSEELEQILIYREAPSPRHRWRYFLGLAYLSEFLRQVGFSAAVADELHELAVGLDDLNRGIVRHYLAPASVKGMGNRLPQPSDLWMAKAHVAIAVDIAVNGGFRIPRKRAAREIAKAHAYLADVLAPTTSNFASAVESWHRQFGDRAVKDDGAQTLFDRRALYVACWNGKSECPPNASEEHRRLADAKAAHDGMLLSAAYLTGRAASPDAVDRARQKKRAQRPSIGAR